MSRRLRSGRRAPLQIEPLENRVNLSVTIQLDYSYDSLGFFASHPQAKADLELAAQILSSQLHDTLKAIVPSGNINTWQEVFFNPGDTSANVTLNNPSVPVNTLIVYAGGSHLPTGVGGLGGSGFSYYGDQTWNDLVASRGQLGALTSNPTDYGPWGGSVSFSADDSWDYSPGTLTTPGGDFFGVALHELTHVLGVGPAGSWSTYADRTNHLFNGPHSDAIYSAKVPLDPGVGIEASDPDSHWALGTMSYGHQAVMTPDAGSDVYTPLDWAALADIGWQVDRLAVTAQPPATVAVGSSFGLTVSAEDPDGLVDTVYNGPITLNLANNPNGATLGGTTTVQAKNGVATFSGLTLSRAGSGYTFTATDGLSTPATSGAINSNQGTQTSLSFTPSNPVFGQLETISAQVVASGVAPTTPTGSVVFKDGSNVLGTVPIDGSGAASLTLSNLLVGQHPITATYSGDSIDVPSSFGATLAVARASTSTILSATPTFTNLGQTVALVAQVKVSAPGTGVPGGTVTFLDGLIPLGSVALDNTGVARLSTLSLGTGANQITASYVGSTNDAPSASGIVGVQIGLDSTSTTLTASTPSVVAGQAETLVATLTSASGRSPTGLVTFSEGATPLGSATLFGGVAQISLSTLGVGLHSITASYLGDGFAAASGPVAVALSVGKASASVALAGPSASTFGRPVVLVATVGAVAPGSTKPTGSVTFSDGSKVLGTVVLDGSSRASYTITSPSLGTHAITATYSGDPNDTALAPSRTSLYVGDGLNNDFDGDGKADPAVYGPDPLTGKYRFKIVPSSTGTVASKAVVFDNNGYGFGNKTSIAIPADYFGDGRAAYALWTPNSLGGMTFTAVSSQFKAGENVTFNFGQTTDAPLLADVDNDGKIDFGVYGFQKGLGYRFDFLLSSKGFNPVYQNVFNNNGYGFGGAQSIPVVADFDGSGHAGFGLYNPATTGSQFTFYSPYTNTSITRAVGTASDIPMTGDFDGDGKSDFALYGKDPASGKFRYEVLTAASSFSTSQAVIFNNFGYGYGGPASIPVMADYEGIGKADFALFVPDNAGGTQFVYQTGQTGAGVTVDFGSAGDLPLEAPVFFRAKKVRGS